MTNFCRQYKYKPQQNIEIKLRVDIHVIFDNSKCIFRSACKKSDKMHEELLFSSLS